MLRFDPRKLESEKDKSRKKSRYAAIKLLMIAIKGYKCEHCGEYHNIRSMSFHHTDGKDIDIAKMIHYARDRKFTKEVYNNLKEEVDKTILLCETCHQRLHEFEFYDTDVYHNSLHYIKNIIMSLNLTNEVKFDIKEFDKMYKKGENYNGKNSKSSTSSAIQKQELKPKTSRNKNTKL